MKKLPKVDHLALAFKNIDWVTDTLLKMGFKRGFYEKSEIGDEKSAMKTVVLSWGDVNLALMEPIDKKIKSQIREYVERYGDGILQHPAIEVEDLKATVRVLKKKGFKFLTPILKAQDKKGLLLQAFTYPLVPGGKPFFEFNQRAKTKKGKSVAGSFSDRNVMGLWYYVAKAIDEGWWFSVNIFGEIKK